MIKHDIISQIWVGRDDWGVWYDTERLKIKGGCKNFSNGKNIRTHSLEDVRIHSFYNVDLYTQQIYYIVHNYDTDELDILTQEEYAHKYAKTVTVINEEADLLI